MLQQNNDPKHRSKSTSEWFQTNKIHALEWPSQSPDLTSIEMLWHDLKTAIHAKHPRNLTELQQFCKEEHLKINPDRCARVICNYLQEASGGSFCSQVGIQPLNTMVQLLILPPSVIV